MTSVTAEPEFAGGEEHRDRSRSRRRLTAAAVGALLIAAAVFTGTRLSSGSRSPRPRNPTGTATSTVQRTNLAQTVPVNGTIGFTSPMPGGPNPLSIVQPAGDPPSALGQAEQSVVSTEQSLVADERAAGDSKAAGAQSVAQAQQSLSTAQATLSADTTQLDNDQAALAADRQKEANDCQGSGSAGGNGPGPAAGASGSSSPCSADAAQVASDQKTIMADQQKLTADQAAVSSGHGQLASTQLSAAQSADQNQAKLEADQLNLAKARSAAADAQTAETVYGQSSKYTALPVPGQVITAGQALWSVDGEAVPLLPGALTPWRAFTPAMSPGPDVAVLKQALIDLGDGEGVTVSDTFTDDTSAAIDRLQASMGLPQTGTLLLGSVIFAPAALRVTGVHPPLGGTVTPGAPVLDVTSTTPVVNVALPVDEAYLVNAGDPVSIKLADGTIATGTITAVGTVATAAPSSGPSGSSSTPSETVNVTVSLSHLPPAATLDQAPVTVNITNGTATNVLAVPTTALLALAGGGYAVEVVAAGGAHHLVAVTTGIFDDQAGMVQVSGAGLLAGQTVVAAA